MPTRNLPNNPSLEHLKNEAKAFKRSNPGLKLTEAQFAVAREYGFASWSALRRHLEIVDEFTRRPSSEPTDFVALACLTYGDDSPDRWQHARKLLDADPSVATAGIHAAAAAGDAATVQHMLAADPELANADGGPHDWSALMYATFSRLPGVDTTDVVRVLLAAGADPTAGYLWYGFPSPFTALTGAFGGGEGDQPPHVNALALARLLLEAGANPNDSQTLYNRSLLGWDNDQPEHIELLLEFGLGQGDGGVWHQRMGFTHPSPSQLLEDELAKAAAYNMPRWASLILGADVDVNGRGTDHPTLEGHSAWQLAMRNGNPEIAAALAAAGATDARQPDAPLFEFLGACMRADRAALDLTLTETAIALRPHHLASAANRGRADAVRLMAEVGFDINAIETSWPHRTTALHRAVEGGSLEVVQLLVELGADLTARDRSFNGTPLGWAQHLGEAEIAGYLESAVM